MPTYAGRLLVATPELRDPNFSHTVVLLLGHNDEGALGVVLNRPSDTPVGEVLPGWAAVVAQPDVVFFGGPVAFDSVVGLGRYDDEEQGGPSFRPIVGSVGTVDLNLPPDAATPPHEVRLFAGSAGWGGGQLEEEIAEGSWFVVDALEDDTAAEAPEDLWAAVLRRQPGRLSWFANAAGDPGLN